MGKRVRSLADYQSLFSDECKRKKAYDLAWEIRKFEIELYWKRATYFWTLIAATFAGYFALAAAQSAPQHPFLRFLVSCIGLVLSTSWYLVNRGSKYWQENWERHVDSLEDEFAGPLYKTTISNDQYHAWRLGSGYPFSVSRLNQFTSLFIAVVWLGVSISTFRPQWRPPVLVAGGPYVLAGLTLFFLYLLIRHGYSRQTDERVIDFYKTDTTL